jgi:hypothetical protein
MSVDWDSFLLGVGLAYASVPLIHTVLTRLFPGWVRRLWGS